MVCGGGRGAAGGGAHRRPDGYHRLRRAAPQRDLCPAKKDETGCAQLYHYAADRTSCFASLDGSLAIVTNSQLLVMQEDGQVVCNETVKWASCTVTGTGSLAAAYDIGGSDVYVLNAQA